MKRQIIWITIAIIVLIILIFTLNSKKEYDPDLPPTLPLDESQTEISSTSYYVLDESLTPLTSENILGTWKAISEQVGIEGIINNNPEDSKITFTKEMYSSTTFGIQESRYYELKDNQIFFYNSKEDINKSGNFLTVQGGIKDNTLTLIFPQFPKKVVYEKVE